MAPISLSQWSALRVREQVQPQLTHNRGIGALAKCEIKKIGIGHVRRRNLIWPITQNIKNTAYFTTHLFTFWHVKLKNYRTIDLSYHLNWHKQHLNVKPSLNNILVVLGLIINNQPLMANYGLIGRDWAKGLGQKKGPGCEWGKTEFNYRVYLACLAKTVSNLTAISTHELS